jgi:hypothetical protein
MLSAGFQMEIKNYTEIDKYRKGRKDESVIKNKGLEERRKGETKKKRKGRRIDERSKNN